MSECKFIRLFQGASESPSLSVSLPPPHLLWPLREWHRLRLGLSLHRRLAAFASDAQLRPNSASSKDHLPSDAKAEGERKSVNSGKGNAKTKLNTIARMLEKLSKFREKPITDPNT